MNYTKLINKFWIKEAEYDFTDKETALYFYLIQTSRNLKWKNPFGLSQNTIISKFRWNKETLNKARETLQNAQLITVQPGNGRGNISQYKLIVPHHITKTTIKEPLITELPFNSSQFATLWNKLTQTPKWKNKNKETLKMTLEKLKEFDENFAIQLIERSIMGGWHGLIFSDTHSQYQKWKTMQTKNNEQAMDKLSEQRKNEIIRRATRAIANCQQ